MSELIGNARVKTNEISPASAVIRKLFPFLKWFDGYSIIKMRHDLLAGVTVALVLIPQSMAYAQLAGLPAYYGLYAAFLPPIIAAMFGSSYQLATGPVAVVSLMTATALGPLASAGSEAYIAYAIMLALVIGIFQLLLGVFRLGLVVNFLSHPVVNGFTNAAAIIIATSQLSKIFGVDAESGKHQYETVYNVIVAAFNYTHLPSLLLAVFAFTLMALLKKIDRRIPNVLIAVVLTTLIAWVTGFRKNIEVNIDDIYMVETQKNIFRYNHVLMDIDKAVETKIKVKNELKQKEIELGERDREVLTLKHRLSLIDLQLSEFQEEIAHYRKEIREVKLEGVRISKKRQIFFCHGKVPSEYTGDNKVYRIKVFSKFMDLKDITLIAGGAVVGEIPKGLPAISIPKINFSIMLDLFSIAVIISILGFMEAISIAKAMCAKTGQRLDPNQELIGQGLANIIGSVARSYPVSGSFSRSAVNLQAGALTGLSSVFSSLIVVLTLMFFTPLLYHLPQSVLAAIIMMAVIGLLNVKGFIHSWQAQKHDGIISIISFVCTLGFAPHLDKGIMIGVALSIGVHLFRNMKPPIAELSKFTDGTFRNADRWGMKKCRHIAVIRFSGTLFFANVQYLEDEVLEQVAGMPELKHVHLVCNGINEIDASGESTLALLVSRLREAGYDVSFSGIPDSMVDVMRRTHLYDMIGDKNIFGNVALAVDRIYEKTHRDSDETDCPLLEVQLVGLKVSKEAFKGLRK